MTAVLAILSRTNEQLGLPRGRDLEADQGAIEFGAGDFEVFFGSCPRA